MTASRSDSYQSSPSLRYKRNLSKYYPLLQPHPHHQTPILSSSPAIPSFITSACTSAQSLVHSPGLQAFSLQPFFGWSEHFPLPVAFKVLHNVVHLSWLVSHHSSQSSCGSKEPFCRQQMNFTSSGPLLRLVPLPSVPPLLCQNSCSSFKAHFLSEAFSKGPRKRQLFPPPCFSAFYLFMGYYLLIFISLCLSSH